MNPYFNNGAGGMCSNTPVNEMPPHLRQQPRLVETRPNGYVTMTRNATDPETLISPCGKFQVISIPHNDTVHVYIVYLKEEQK